MASKSKSKKASASKEDVAVAVPLAEQKAPKSMTKEEARSVLDQYSGINGTEVPAIVQKARQVLKSKSE